MVTRGGTASMLAAMMSRQSTRKMKSPFASRCYAKLGFKPTCFSWHYPRALSKSLMV